MGCQADIPDWPLAGDGDVWSNDATVSLFDAGDGSTQVMTDGGLGFPWFERHIKPIMSAYCTSCHGETPIPTAPQGFRLDVCEDETVQGARPMAARILARTVRGEGSFMPPGATRSVNEQEAALISRWVEIGAPCLESEIDRMEPPMVMERYHPEGFVSPEAHGLATKLQTEDCRDCHGDQLQGGDAISCDTCHPADWREQCTFCHGGEDNQTGAPPRPLDANRPERFPVHTAHVVGTIHAPFDCVHCHTKPTNVMSAGHIFDDTPGRAEVRFDEGLSPMGVYDGDGGCNNLYCHGNGRSLGSYNGRNDAVDCSSCHAGPMSGRDGWSQLSGEHEEHLRRDVECNDCHGDGGRQALIEAHVNGRVDLALPPSIEQRGRTCTGTCHGEDHEGVAW